MWNLPVPPGFQGLRSDIPLTVYLRHMPHWRQEGATYFATFRLQDSLPQNKLRQLKALRKEWESRHSPPYSTEVLDELARETFRQVEQSLDQGMGSCVLRHGDARQYVTEAMHHFDGTRYELDCYVIMPNHAHVIVRPKGAALERVLQSWKRHSARRINQIKGAAGAVWQEESHDRIVRDEEHLWRTIQYIGKNAIRAGLADMEYRRWIRPEWVDLGWRFEE